MNGAQAHGWLPPSWRALIETVHTRRCDTVVNLQTQLQSTCNGFASLPVNESLSGSAPAPVSWERV
jgi:MoxR-like ATPase